MLASLRVRYKKDTNLESPEVVNAGMPLRKGENALLHES